MSKKLKTKNLRHIIPFIKDQDFFLSRNKKLKQNKSQFDKIGLSLINRSYQIKMVARLAKMKNKKLPTGGFAQKLQSRRLFSFFYGPLSRKYHLRLLSQAKSYKGKVGVQFLALLEKRLDIVVYRMFLFDTLRNARQFLLHQGILVNNRLTKTANYQLKPGDLLQILNPVSFFVKHPFFKFFLKKENDIRVLKNYLFFKFPHLEVNYKVLSGIFLFSPQQIYSPLKFTIKNFIYSLK